MPRPCVLCKGGSRAAWNNNLKPPSPKEIHSPLVPHQERVGHPPDARPPKPWSPKFQWRRKPRLAADTAAAVGRHVLRTGCRLLAAAVSPKPLPARAGPFFVRHTTVNTALLSTRDPYPVHFLLYPARATKSAAS